MYKFTPKLTMADAIHDMTVGKIVLDMHLPKIVDIINRLDSEGYNPYEYLLFFTNRFIGAGGLNQIRLVNKWTSDVVWIAFLEYKRIAKTNTQRWYEIQMREVKRRLYNNLSTELDILETTVTSADIIVKMDLAFKWYETHPEVNPFMKSHWELAMINIKGSPEYLPHTKYTAEYLINRGNIEYVR